MSRLIFEEEYVIVVPTFKDVKPHQHDFYHLFFLESGDGQEVFVTGSKMLHTMPPIPECRLFLLIDPTSDLAASLQEQILGSGLPERIRPKTSFAFSEAASAEGKTDEEIRAEVRNWLLGSGFLTGKAPAANASPAADIAPEDYRVVKLIRDIREYRHLEKTVGQIAKEYKLSESRLSHVFKETVGISLKGYLMIARLRYAYQLVMEGKSKTFAAMEAGFAGPAHLAYICKKQMGISISEVLK